MEVHKEAGGIRLTGFIAALAEQGPTRGPQNVFINRRIVKDKTIAHAIIDAYSQASIKERSPEVHLFIEMPPDARRRQRAPDEGGGAVPRSVAGARGGAPRADGRARAAAPRRSCSCGRSTWRRRRSRRRCRTSSRAARIRTAGCPQRSDEEPQSSQSAQSALWRTENRAFSAVSAVSGGSFFAAVGHPTDDSARAVPRHVHHRGGRRGGGDHRSARRARARAVRAGDGAADERAGSSRSGCWCRW